MLVTHMSNIDGIKANLHDTFLFFSVILDQMSDVVEIRDKKD